MKREDRFGETYYVGGDYEKHAPQETVIGEVGYTDDTLTHFDTHQNHSIMQAITCLHTQRGQRVMKIIGEERRV